MKLASSYMYDANDGSVWRIVVNATPIRIPPSRHPQILERNLQNARNHFSAWKTLPKARRALGIAGWCEGNDASVWRIAISDTPIRIPPQRHHPQILRRTLQNVRLLFGKTLPRARLALEIAGYLRFLTYARPMAAAPGALSSNDTSIRIRPSRHHPQSLQRNLQNARNHFSSRKNLPRARRALGIAGYLRILTMATLAGAEGDGLLMQGVCIL